MKRINYENQIFGNRKIISNYCTDEDWIKIGKKVPSEKNKVNYRLSECLLCGTKIPVLMTNLKRQPPKGCSFCTNIGHRSTIESFKKNSWTIDKTRNIGIGNIYFHNQIVPVFVDVEDVERVAAYQWRISKKRNKYYVVTSPKGKQQYLHSFVLGKKAPEGYEIDHIDSNSLNNCKNNLRIVSRNQNIRNVNVRIDNQIGIRGVSYDKRSSKYTVDASYDKQRFYFKQWKTLEEAVWCRKAFEDYFDLKMMSRNPLAQEYLNIESYDRQNIINYTKNQISRKRR